MDLKEKENKGMTQEKVEGKAVQEEPVLFKEPEKRTCKGMGTWVLGLIIIGVFYFMSGTPQITGVGTLKAQKYIKLQAAVPGTLKEIVRKKGDLVQAGEVLAHFENAEIIKELGLKKKALQISDEELSGFRQKEAYLKTKNERATVLFENGVIGKSDFEKVALEYGDFQKRVSLHIKKMEALKEELAYLENESGKLGLKAPFTGVLLSDSTEKLSNYFTREDDVFEIGNPASFFLEMAVKENQIEKVHIGDRAFIQFAALPQKKYSGVVTSIGVKTNQEVEKVFKVRHVVVCEIKLNEEMTGLRYGMKAHVTIQGAGGSVQGLRKKLITKGESYFDGAFKS
jgi:multidrug resistance efflux pump